MRAVTRLFGEIDIAEDKLIVLKNGMIGLPEFQKFALIFDEEKGMENSTVMWLQSMDDPETAFPVMQPNKVKPDYNPTVNEKMISSLGTLNEENIYVLVTLTATAEVEEMSVNLKAPIVVNTDTREGCQIIVEDDYPVKFKIYDVLKDKKKAEE